MSTRFRMALASLTFVVCLAFFMFVSLGGTVRGRIDPILFVLAVVWTGPTALLVSRVRTVLGALFATPIVVAGTFVFLVSIFLSTSSTSAIDLIAVPWLFYLGVALFLVLERVLLKRGAEQEGRSAQT